MVAIREYRRMEVLGMMRAKVRDVPVGKVMLKRNRGSFH